MATLIFYAIFSIRRGKAGSRLDCYQLQWIHQQRWIGLRTRLTSPLWTIKSEELRLNATKIISSKDEQKSTSSRKFSMGQCKSCQRPFLHQFDSANFKSTIHILEWRKLKCQFLWSSFTGFQLTFYHLHFYPYPSFICVWRRNEKCPHV